MWYGHETFHWVFRRNQTDFLKREIKGQRKVERIRLLFFFFEGGYLKLVSQPADFTNTNKLRRLNGFTEP
jgi:hypothetical protein